MDNHKDDDDDNHDDEKEERRGNEIPFPDLELFFEFNSTDNDLGVHISLDGEAWKRLKARDPGKRTILDIEVRGRLKKLGLTQLFFESAEPSPGEVLALFPPGEYEFEAATLGGDTLVGTPSCPTTSRPCPCSPRPTVQA